MRACMHSSLFALSCSREVTSCFKLLSLWLTLIMAENQELWDETNPLFPKLNFVRVFYHSDRNETRKAHICVRGRGPPQVSSSGTSSTGSETGLSLVCHSPFRPCWLASGSQESSCPFSQCLHDGHIQLFFSCWSCGLNASLYSCLANSLPTDPSPRPLEFSLLEGSLIIDSVSLLIIGSLEFFFSWCCHDYSTFPSGTLPISFYSIICWDIIASPYLILEASWDPLQPCSLGCNALALTYSCVLVTPPHHCPAKSLVSLENHQHLPPFLLFSYSLFHFLLLWFSFLSIAASRFGSPFFYFLWL